MLSPSCVTTFVNITLYHVNITSCNNISRLCHTYIRNIPFNNLSEKNFLCKTFLICFSLNKIHLQYWILFYFISHYYCLSRTCTVPFRPPRLLTITSEPSNRPYREYSDVGSHHYSDIGFHHYCAQLNKTITQWQCCWQVPQHYCGIS